MKTNSQLVSLTQQVNSENATQVCKKFHGAMLRYPFCQGLRPLAASDALPGTMKFSAESVFNCGF